MGPEDEELFAGPSLALYSFEPENSNELRLEEGQEIMVSYRHGQGWLVASDPRSGEQGLVPEAYVRLIAEMPNYDPETGEFFDMEDETSPVDTSHSQPHYHLSGAEHGNGNGNPNLRYDRDPDLDADADGIIPVDEEREPRISATPAETSSAETSPSPVKLNAPKLPLTTSGSQLAHAEAADGGG